MLLTAIVNNQACHDPQFLTQCFELLNSSNTLELLFFDHCLRLVVFISLISRLGPNASFGFLFVFSGYILRCSLVLVLCACLASSLSCWLDSVHLFSPS